MIVQAQAIRQSRQRSRLTLVNMLYNISGTAVSVAYDVENTEIMTVYDINGLPIPIANYNNPTYTPLFTVTVNNTQGFDIHNGVMFQFRAGGSVSDVFTSIDMATGSIIASDVTAVSGHGDSATFSTEYYAENDEYPLLYVSADTTPYIYVDRVTASSSTLVQTIYLPYTVAGYHACATFNWHRNIMYTVGTVEDNYLTDDDGKNPCIVCEWDLSSMTGNGDGSYTPTLIRTYQRPFIYVMQGQQYFGGYIWICSGYSTGSQYIYAMNPNTGTIEYTLTMPITTEIEGLSWQMKNGTPSIIVGFQGGVYYEISF